MISIQGHGVDYDSAGMCSFSKSQFCSFCVDRYADQNILGWV